MAGREKWLGAAARGRIAASPERLWAIVSDPSRHPEIAGSSEPQETTLLTEGPLRVGSKFRSRQKVRGARYTSTSTVVTCEAPRLLRWSLEGGRVEWEYHFEPSSDGSTLATHSFRWNVAYLPLLDTVVGPLLHWRHRQVAESLPLTLRKLARLAGAPEPSDLLVSSNAPAMGGSG